MTAKMQDSRIVYNYNAQPGWVTIGGKTFYSRCKLERRWATYLEMLKTAGEILYWEYETKTFWFDKIKRGRNSYKPDFFVQYPDGTMLWHECKGYLQNTDLTKWRRLAKYFPNEKLVVIMQSLTKKNRPKLRMAEKYTYRIINGGQILRKVGL